MQVFLIHLLVVPRILLKSPEDLSEEHIELLQEMKKWIDNCLIRELRNAYPNKLIRYGFHTDPSQEHLHCHVYLGDPNTDGYHPELKAEARKAKFREGRIVDFEHLINICRNASSRRWN